MIWWQRWDWLASSWLVRHGIWQAKEEGGWYADCRVAPLRCWFRGRAPTWGTRASRPEPGEPVKEPPFYLVTDRSIPPDEVHFRDHHGRTLGVMKLGDGHTLVIPRKANDTVPVRG